MTTLKFGIMIANTIMKLKQKPSTATKNLQHRPFTVQQMSTEMQLSKLSQGNATLTSSHLPNTRHGKTTLSPKQSPKHAKHSTNATSNNLQNQKSSLNTLEEQ